MIWHSRILVMSRQCAFGLRHTPSPSFKLRPLSLKKVAFPHLSVLNSRSLSTTPCFNQSPPSPSSDTPELAETTACLADKIAQPALDHELLLNALGEPTFASLGLAHGYPSGWVQALLEFIHVETGLPWWATIAVNTVLIRLLIFPIVVKAQRNMVQLNNILPEVQAAQIETMRARDPYEVKVASEKLQAVYQKNQFSPLFSYAPMVAQACVFTSVFFGLRGMAHFPVESMKSQGMLWFTDLTVADPYYLLPIMTTGSLWLFFHFGSEGLNLNTLPPFFRKMMYILPLVSFPVMIQFPAALNVFWLTNNIITITQANIIRSDIVRHRLGIEKMIKWKPEQLPLSSLTMEQMTKPQPSRQTPRSALQRSKVIPTIRAKPVSSRKEDSSKDSSS